MLSIFIAYFSSVTNSEGLESNSSRESAEIFKPPILANDDFR
jgi:hypothetical protein